MEWFKDTLVIDTRGKGLYPMTSAVNACIQNWKILDGMIFLFIQHTSASLIISENYDPSAKTDIENFLERLAPEGQSWYEHTLEGRDDSPAHLRSVLTNTDLSIPIDAGRLSMGTWQGIYLFEHRRRPQRRGIQIRGLKAA